MVNRLWHFRPASLASPEDERQMGDDPMPGPFHSKALKTRYGPDCFATRSHVEVNQSAQALRQSAAEVGGISWEVPVT